jgi:uncharacterized repeat protein (TIGR04076 family)
MHAGREACVHAWYGLIESIIYGRGVEDIAENSAPRVTARVISQKGNCVAGHTLGSEFVISSTCPDGMCAWAFYAGFPFATVLMFGGKFPWESDADRTTFACPDRDNPVVFELKREK